MNTIDPIEVLAVSCRYYWAPVLLAMTSAALAILRPTNIGQGFLELSRRRRQNPALDFSFLAYGLWGILAIDYMADGVAAGHPIRDYDQWTHIQEYLAAVLAYTVLLFSSVVVLLATTLRNRGTDACFGGSWILPLFAGLSVFADFFLVLVLWVAAAEK